MQQPFVVGQRWLSETEPDLGLGAVEQVEGRQVRLYFAASGEHRTYARGNAPLVRVHLPPDETLQDRDGRTLTVRAVEERAGLLSYRCVDARGDEVVLPEAALNDRLRLNRPQDRLLARRLDPDTWFTLRHQAWSQAAALWRSPVFGLQGPRVDLIPHQLYIAAEVGGRGRARVLLADEVGLGKTIEAGLILHRLLLTERVRRVLILVPDALVNQWLVEMLRRFNLRFAVFDRARFDEAGDANPFHSEQRVLCALSLLVGEPVIGQAALAGDWDLLIVDEAHHLSWSEQGGGPDYALVEGLAAHTDHMLLLTATPEQLGRAGHFGRLRLLDPQRFHDYPAFLAEEAAYQPVAAIVAKLLEERPPDDADRRLLGAWLGAEAALPGAEIIDRLIDRHGTGRVLFRNTRQAIKGFPRRHLNAYPLALPTAYAAHAADPAPERAHGDGWVAFDPRVDWLRALLTDLAPAKVLVICAHAETVIALRDRLLDRYAIHAALFHERMEIVARDRAAAFFADPEGGAQVLICSEIGSEGRNFQFAHHLVLFDLPLDPDLLEQRIGRLDRIGQRATIELHVPYLSDSAGEVLLRWYRDGLASLEAVCPAASAVYQRLGERLRETLGAPGRVDRLVAEAARLTRELNAELEAGRDRLLELQSYRPEPAATLLAALRRATGVVALADYMTAYWDAFGVEHEPGPGGSLVLRPGAHMLHDHFPGLGAEPVTATFERSDALAHEDRLFLTWEHPMVLGCLEMLTSGELGSAAVTVVSHPDYRTGTVLLEALFVVECAAPRGLMLQRYLPPTCLRYLLDANGEDRAARLSHDALSGLCLAHNRKLADTVIQSQRERLKPLLAIAGQMAERDGAATAAAARAAMTEELDAERQRLAALARVNPTVRREEIDQLAQRREAIGAHLDDTRVRLDALRIVVMR